MTTSATPAAATPRAAVGTVKSTAENSVFVRMAERFGMDPVAFDRTIRATIFPSDKKEASAEQAAAFLIVADQYKLNPFIKEIYAFPNKAGGITPIIGVDGWHTLCQRHEQYGGFSQEVVNDETFGAGIKTTIIRRDWSQPVVHVEWLTECKRNTEPWAACPGRMLGHKSFIQTARMAFGFAGIYDEDEAERIRDVEARIIDERPSGMDGLRRRLGPGNSADVPPAAEPATSEAAQDEPGAAG